jgi:hypothetical protein
MISSFASFGMTIPSYFIAAIMPAKTFTRAWTDPHER